MKILVTGAAGFLGRELIQQFLEQGKQVVATGRKSALYRGDPNTLLEFHQLDFTDPFQVHDIFEEVLPDVVIHAGAMTRVDDCEEQQWLAFQTNVEGTLNMLMNARERKCFFVFISTDFVFDGKKGTYIETDDRAPVNFYGKTKMEAEDAVMEYDFDWSIVRTSLVYGKPEPGRTNILSVLKEKLDRQEKYRVVSDQFRSPTYVGDLAAGILSIAEKKAKGIFHLAGKDILSPYEMAMLTAHYFKKDPSIFEEVTAAGFTQPAKRPPVTNLVIEKARLELGFQPVSFAGGLEKTFTRPQSK